MSLISDTDFLLHSIRLAYLRNVEDPYGPRLITLNPSYTSNPYIVAASLADTDKWPELDAPSSPPLSEDDGERPSGFPGASGLKYTSTIMAGKSGAMGLRVNGKRASTSKRMSGTPQQLDVKNYLSKNAPVQESLISTVPISDGLKASGADNLEKASSQTNVHIQSPTAPVEAPVAKVVQFIPKFKGAEEMEARRRVRMAARKAPDTVEATPPPTHNLEFSSDEGDDDDEFDNSGNGSLDDGDEFDPDFAATETPGANSDSASDIISLSGVSSIASTSIPTFSSNVNNHLRQRHRLSPVSEGGRPNSDRSHQSRSTHHRPSEKSGDTYFEMLTPAPKQEDGKNVSSRKTEPTSRHKGTRPIAATPEMAFPRRKVPPIRPLKSALSAMLASSGTSSNPFAELYAAISGRAESASTDVNVYFPIAREPAGTPMKLNVRKDATVEEVIGFALWSYWEEGWLPKLDDGLGGEDDPKWATKLSAVGWIMRIAEDDGEVDDDFPPPDRNGKIAKFNADAYAVLEANTAQIQQNQVLESKIQRRPSRTATAKKPERAALTLPLPGGGSSSMFNGSSVGSLPLLSTSLGPSSSHGPQIYLRIRVADTADAVHISTTIKATAGMYMQEALEAVCQKRQLDPKDYALLLADKSILIPLDRTVASLQGKKELVLIKRSMLGDDVVKGTGRTTDPNASIFKRMSDTPEQQYSSILDYTAAYKKYTIYRKMPMLVARQERTLAIDGVYIHIMPSTNKAKAVFDSGKTASYHIQSIAECQQSTKSSSVFKLVLGRAGGNKRYDFEAESPKLAAEIVQTVRTLKAALERNPTVKSRRSRQVV